MLDGELNFMLRFELLSVVCEGEVLKLKRLFLGVKLDK